MQREIVGGGRGVPVDGDLDGPRREHVLVRRLPVVSRESVGVEEELSLPQDVERVRER